MTQSQIIQVNNGKEIPATIAIMGDSIRQAAQYFPLIQYARQLAAQAPSHDYLGQMRAIYDDIVANWKYVRDPYHIETMTVTGPEIMRFTFGFKEDGTREYGTGDCDDISIGLAAALLATGANVRLVTSSESTSPDDWSHVFVQADVPGYGWISIDPVLYPDQGFGDTVSAAKLGYWDLHGKLENLNGSSLSGPVAPNERIFDLDEIHCCPTGWGSEIDKLGYIGNANNFNVELTPADYLDSEHAVTPILAFSPDDFEYIQTVGYPYPGMKGFGNTGYIYEWTKDSSDRLGYKPGDFFRAIGRGVKRVFSGIKKVVSWVWDKIENVFEATAFGRWVLRVKDKVIEFAVNIVTPLAKLIGKWAPAFAPIAAMIPGVGIALSAYAIAAGGMAKAFNEYGVPIINVIQAIDGEDVEIPMPDFVSDIQEIEVIENISNFVDEARDLTETQLQFYTDVLAEYPPDPETPFELPPVAQAIVEAQMQVDDLNRQANAWRRASEASQAYHAIQAENFSQQAAYADEAQHNWFMSQPEVIAAHDTARASAQANSAYTIESGQAAQIAAQAARDSATRAIENQLMAIALDDPEVRAQELAASSLNLNAIGYGIKFV